MISNATNLAVSDAASLRERPRISADRLLSLAAAPTFAVMALLTAIYGDSMPDVLCSATQDALQLTGMVPMYLLMSAFHLGPWLQRISHR